MKFFIFSLLLIIWLGLTPQTAEAFFTVYPTKMEFSLEPGEQAVKNVTVVNNSSSAKTFSVTVEDFVAAGGDSQNEDIEIGNLTNNPLSLYRHVLTNKPEFILQGGEQTTVQVMVNLPRVMPPGSKHAVFLISSSNAYNLGAAKTISRVGVLLFVRVEGEEVFSGEVVDSNVSYNVDLLNQKPLNIMTTYNNTGNTYLNPYGYVEIKNLITREVFREPIDPWFVLPNSFRTREVEISSLPLGIFGAKILMNRGYDNIVDETESHYFVKLNPTFTIIFSLLIILVGLLVGFKIKKKYV